MPFERYAILLPLNYNDGTPIEPEKFQETRRELVGQLGLSAFFCHPSAV